MAKYVHVAGTTSVDPQEVPGYTGTFPQPLKDSGMSEKDWLAIKSGDEALFEIRDVRGDVPDKDEGTALEAAVEGSDS